MSLADLLARSARAEKLRPSPIGDADITALAYDGVDVPVRIRRHPRSRSISLRIDPQARGILLTMPRGVPVAEALAFAHQRKDWVMQRLDRLSAQPVIGDGSEIAFRGHPHIIRWSQKGARKPHIADGEIVLGGAGENVGRRIERWLREEALDAIRADAAVYFARAAISNPPRVGLTNARRRWGSCSTHSGLRIHWRLIMAPDMVRRSVIAHEVAHLRHMDHSAEFYGWLDTLFQENRIAADRWLKQHGQGLYQLDFAAC